MYTRPHDVKKKKVPLKDNNKLKPGYVIYCTWFTYLDPNCRKDVIIKTSDGEVIGEGHYVNQLVCVMHA